MATNRRWINRLGSLFLTIVLAGCYESSHPLSQGGEVRQDAGILGKWRCVPDSMDESDDRAVLQVLPFDDFQYYAEWKEEEHVTRYRAYAVQVNESVLLNVQELKSESQNKWVFVRYRLQGDGKLKLAVVSDKSVKGSDEMEKMQDIRSRAGDDALYEPLAVCVRE